MPPRLAPSAAARVAAGRTNSGDGDADGDGSRFGYRPGAAARGAAAADVPPTRIPRARRRGRRTKARSRKIRRKTAKNAKPEDENADPLSGDRPSSIRELIRRFRDDPAVPPEERGDHSSLFWWMAPKDSAFAHAPLPEVAQPTIRDEEPSQPSPPPPPPPLAASASPQLPSRSRDAPAAAAGASSLSSEGIGPWVSPRQSIAVAAAAAADHGEAARSGETLDARMAAAAIAAVTPDADADVPVREAGDGGTEHRVDARRESTDDVLVGPLADDLTPEFERILARARKRLFETDAAPRQPQPQPQVAPRPPRSPGRAVAVGAGARARPVVDETRGETALGGDPVLDDYERAMARIRRRLGLPPFQLDGADAVAPVEAASLPRAPRTIGGEPGQWPPAADGPIPVDHTPPAAPTSSSAVPPPASPQREARPPVNPRSHNNDSPGFRPIAASDAVPKPQPVPLRIDPPREAPRPLPTAPPSPGGTSDGAAVMGRALLCTADGRPAVWKGAPMGEVSGMARIELYLPACAWAEPEPGRGAAASLRPLSQRPSPPPAADERGGDDHSGDDEQDRVGDKGDEGKEEAEEPEPEPEDVEEDDDRGSVAEEMRRQAPEPASEPRVQDGLGSIVHTLVSEWVAGGPPPSSVTVPVSNQSSGSSHDRDEPTREEEEDEEDDEFADDPSIAVLLARRRALERLLATLDADAEE